MFLKAVIVLATAVVIILALLFSILRIISRMESSDITHLKVNFRKMEVEIKRSTSRVRARAEKSES